MRYILSVYERVTLHTPLITWLTVLLLTLSAGYYAQNFKLDASADALVLENDRDLRYYRGVRARYGSDDFLVVTYTPRQDLFSPPVLEKLEQLRDELAALERVEGVVSILDVPLLDSPRTSLSEIQQHIRTLEDPDTDPALAREEFRTSPLYRSLLTNPTGTTTVMMVNLRQDKEYRALLDRRDVLWAKQSEAELSSVERDELEQLNFDIKMANARLQNQQQADIAAVRAILDKFRDHAEIHLGGVPMISSDMIDYIRNDIRTFGVGVALFIVILLAVAFKRIRWVLVPITICALTVVGMVGYLGLVDWRVTVVSSNFISLLLIITLSLIVHLVVRHQELHAHAPASAQADMLRETVRSKVMPSVYTSLTTMVAFASLLVSGIRPVIDFGWMMVIGVGLAFILTFLMLPALLSKLSPGTPIFRRHDATAVLTRTLARLIERFGWPVLGVYALVAVLSVAGILRLTVENRFIDYFKESTEIHQGMLLIDKELGGTTPLDVVLDPDKMFRKALEEEANAAEEPPPADEEMDFLDELYAQEEEDAGISGTSYWYNVFQLEEIQAVHDYLESLPETGKVLSMATTFEVIRMLNKGDDLDNFSLAVMHKKLPEEVKKTLFDPYLSEDGNQLRFSIRVIDSDENLLRDALLKKIKHDLEEKLGLEPEQVHLSGMLVLYNNVLQSLFRSQIVTLSAVFLAILLMLMLLFRSFKLAAVGVLPTVTAAGLILGLMGWLAIPLDIMTITIAAITIGIGVDNSIHYIHRFRDEIRAAPDDYWGAVKRSHASVGRAIFYTAVTITVGFSILALSNFIPTIYFGLLTGLAMVVALLANLTLLPLLLVKFRAT